MKKYISAVSVAILTSLLLFGILTEAKAAVTVLSVGGPGWIGQNLEQMIGPGTGYTIVTNSFTGTKNKISISLENPSGGLWNTQFRGAAGQDIGLGVTDNVIKYNASPTTIAGLNISGGGHGNTTVSGYFDVKEIVFSGTTVTKLAIDGFQITDGDPNDWAKFSFRFNSDVAITSLSSIVAIPEPSMLALFLPFVGMLTLRRKR
ncbi:hypothetical protein H7X65_01275 [Candidatus Parcubacteria bacterium]|nr:hypothetical protein [Candidatus Parcubacteria bacterium]